MRHALATAFAQAKAVASIVLDDGTTLGQTRAVLTRDQLLEHCLALPGAWPDEPWEGDTVAKVGDKIFAFLGEGSVGVKAGRSRDEADEWLTRYPDDASVMAYIGRYGWNTLCVGGAVADDEILEAIDTSYADVVARLPKSKRPQG
ncbi:MAG TPA: MmcQ/YjbR family DNA-binding protein [Actinomycetales bacterium]|nr:MmcQ/YjbR family DNA-binding protein [Actinomycetales bacterium]